jgi:hypothetical protein
MATEVQGDMIETDPVFLSPSRSGMMLTDLRMGIRSYTIKRSSLGSAKNGDGFFLWLVESKHLDLPSDPASLGAVDMMLLFEYC